MIKSILDKKAIDIIQEKVQEGLKETESKTNKIIFYLFLWVFFIAFVLFFAIYLFSFLIKSKVLFYFLLIVYFFPVFYGIYAINKYRSSLFNFVFTCRFSPKKFISNKIYEDLENKNNYYKAIEKIGYSKERIISIFENSREGAIIYKKNKKIFNKKGIYFDCICCFLFFYF